MNAFLDLTSLIFLVIAIVIFWRLRSVLGTRTGNEKPPFDPFAGRKPEVEAPPAGDNVVTLPREGRPDPREAVMARWDASEKTYLAVVEGRPDPARGTIDQPLRLDETEYRVHAGAHPDAKPAVTHYQTERTAGGRSLVRVRLETGRQHQIRAHLAWLGCPVVGDPRYGAAGRRMGLHALSLKIIHPGDGQELRFEAPVPADFRALMPPPSAGAR